jgi:hypothetical protein
VKLFHCDRCGQVLFFENSQCNSCHSALGYVAEAQRLMVLPDTQEPGAAFPLAGMGNGLFVRCRNYSERQACNWLVAAPQPKLDTNPEPGADAALAEAPYCRSCELTAIIPDLSDSANLAAWADIERAKRRLLYTLLALELPVSSRAREPETGVAFHFLRGTKREPVMTGHNAGIITLNVAEAHAAYRENTREKLGEAYRTVLGHLRHEIGHYYWDRLIADGPRLDAFRALFGDERGDYQQAIQRHYDQGPPANWAESFISAYATMHPWEDWAETWAHYLHMHDTLETAKSHGVAVQIPDGSGERMATDTLVFRDFDALAASWQALTVTLNSLSRSMGLPDTYPFVLSKPVQDKLRFIHGVIQERATDVQVAPPPPAPSGQPTAAEQPAAEQPALAQVSPAPLAPETGGAKSSRGKPASSRVPVPPGG